MSGNIPEEKAARTQAENLEGLARLLQLDGFQCTALVNVDDCTVPLLVRRDGESVAIGVQSGLLAAGWNGHSLTQLRSGQARTVLNDYILRRNLPDEHQLVRGMF
jgi:hypothetical protein